MNKSEAILRAVAEELKRRRDHIDGSMGLRTVTITVKLDGKTGVPRAIEYASQEHREL